jgi:outer membrane murein-binding lipoprotein Lpp
MKITKIKFFKTTILLLLTVFLFTGCQQKSSNPDSQKIKEMQDEVVDLKVKTDQMSEDFASIKQDLEIIKQHLVPSYQAKVDDETETTDVEVKTEEGEQTTAVDVVVDDKKSETTVKTETEVKTVKTDTTNRPKPVVTVPKDPKTAQTKNLPKEPSKPASNKIGGVNDGTHPPLKAKPAEPTRHQTPKKEPADKILNQPKIPEPKTPEPREPAKKSDARNINYTFSDIMDHPYKQYIGVLATIGDILDRDSGIFEPEEVITKAEFLTWLFKTYNAYHKNNILTANPDSILMTFLTMFRRPMKLILIYRV